MFDWWFKLFPPIHGQRGYERGKQQAIDDSRGEDLNGLIALKNKCGVCKTFSHDLYDEGYFTWITEIIRRERDRLKDYQ